MDRSYDILVVGGGPAGLASAVKAWNLGVEKIALLDESDVLGGVLPQCIHPGFGLHYLGEDLTGPEFAERLVERLENSGVEVFPGAYVDEVRVRSYYEKEVYGYRRGEAFRFKCKTLVYAAGCRERSRFEIGVVGDRPAGVYTAGEAQTLMDLYGVLPGSRVVVVGSGDVGLIMARRFVLEGARVEAVVEIMPYPGGLTRNLVQCVEDFGIPLYLSHAVVRVRGAKRVEAVDLVKVDEHLNPIPGTDFTLSCDTVVVAVGLRPRAEILARAGALIDKVTGGPVVNDWLETSLPGVFAAGNVLVVNDLVDYAAEQGEWAAESAVRFIEDNGLPSASFRRVVPGRNVRFTVPQLVSCTRDVVFYGRVLKPEENVTVRFEEAGRSFKAVAVRPSEMFRFKISAEELSRVEGRVLTVKVVRS